MSLALFQEARIRAFFTAGNLLLLGLYLWAGNEVVPMTVVLEDRMIWATAGERTVSAALSSVGGGRLALGITPESPPVSDEFAVDSEWVTGLRRALAANLSAGVDELRVYDLDGVLLAGPYSFRESHALRDPPVQVNGEPALVRETYRLLGEGDVRNARLELNLINGGSPVLLLLRLNDRFDGIAIQAWPDRRELSIHELRAGVLLPELDGGYQSLRKPATQNLQSVAREILRTWLVSLLLLCVGLVGAPPLRLAVGSSDWRSPATAGPLSAAILAGLGLAVTAWIASDVLERIPHVQDSVASLFQARTFALGRLSVPVPPTPDAFGHEFILMREDAWFSKYAPGHPLLLALGVIAGAPWLVSPVAAAGTIVLLYVLGRQLYSGGVGLLAASLLLTSPFFLFMSGSMMSHPTSLLLTTVGLVFLVRSVSSDRVWPPLLAGVALGWLFATRQMTGVAVLVPAVIWLVVQRLRKGRSVGGVVALGLGWSWPVLLLLAYNRALTGDPLLSPFQLWNELDRPGFGPLAGVHGGHDLARGLWNTYANVRALALHLYGWPTYLTLAFALLPFVTGRVYAADWLCGAVLLSMVAAYVAYWADGIMFGPRYYYEVVGMLALLTARGIVVAAELTSGSTRSIMRRRTTAATWPLYALLVLGLVGANFAVNLPRQIDLHRGYNFVSAARQQLVSRAGLERALVLVRTSEPFAWWDYGSVFSANDPLLQADVIYGRDLGPVQNARTRAAFPDRTVYLLSEDGLKRLTP